MSYYRLAAFSVALLYPAFLFAASDVLLPGQAAAAADMTQDGRPDVVIASQSGPSDPGTVTVYENVDGEHFNQRAVVAGSKALGKWSSVLTADFDGDGHLDVAANGPNGSLVLFGDGKGHLLLPTYITPAGLSAVGAGAFTTDGRQQLVFSSSKNPQTIIVQPARDGSSTIVYRVGVYVTAAADVDGDGRTDLVESAPTTAIGFNDWPTFTYVPSPGGRLLDFDGDGVLDLYLRDTNNPPGGSLQRNHRDRTSEAPQGRLANLELIAAGDFNGDGKPDLLGPNFLYINLGDNTFEAAEAPLQYDFGAVADFNGDGKADLLMYQSGTAVVIAFNRLAQTGSKPVTLKFEAIPGPGWTDVPCCSITTSSPDGGQPTGGLTFRENGTILGYSNTRGFPRFGYPGIGGRHTIAAKYSGNATYAPASVETTFDRPLFDTQVSSGSIGNFARLPIIFPTYLSSASGQSLVSGETFKGKITLHVGNADGDKIVTVDAARYVEVSLSLPAGFYRYWAEYTGDRIHSSAVSELGASVTVYDYPVALDKTTITVTPVSKPYYDYDVAVTFHDATGAPFTLPGGKPIDVVLTTSKGYLIPNQQPFAPQEALHWQLYGLGTPPRATLFASIGGVLIAIAEVGPPPPRHRSAGH
jgi:FG-GAP-like repeat